MAEPNDLGWIPADARRWAGENNALLEIVAGELVNTGHWPSAAELTRRLARQGRPIPVADLLWRMPRTIGFIDTHADEVVILLQGLRMTAAGRPLLDGFIRVLRLAVERYASDDPNPVLRRADISFFSGNSDEWVRALSEVVLREAPFLGSGTGSVDDEWSREISDGIVRYWNVQSPDDYLEARAVELKAGAALGWEPIPLLDEHGQVIEPIEQFPAQPAGPKPGPATTRSNDRDGFVSHAGEDLEVAEGVGRLLTKMGWHIWLDKLEMTVGDTLTMALNEALARSRFGVVILSRAFFAKHWPQQELAALAAREATSGTKVILPVWHGIDENYLAEAAPMLANRIGVSTDQGLEHVAAELNRALEKSRAVPRDPARTDPVVQSVFPKRQHDPQLSEHDPPDPDLDVLHEGVPPWMVPRLVRWLDPFLMSSDDLGERFPIPEHVESLESSLRLSVPIDRGNVMGDVQRRIEHDPNFGIDVIRYALSTMQLARTPTHDVTDTRIPALERMLDESGSVWEVSELGVEGGVEGENRPILTRREPPGGKAD